MKQEYMPMEKCMYGKGAFSVVEKSKYITHPDAPHIHTFLLYIIVNLQINIVE